MPTFVPEASGQEFFRVLFLFLFFTPLGFLSICNHFKCHARHEKGKAKSCGWSESSDTAECTWVYRIQSNDWQETQADPTCLSGPSKQEHWWVTPDLVEPGILAVFGRYARKEMASHWAAVSESPDKIGADDTHLDAQMNTAALKAICLQSQKPPSAADFPKALFQRLGHPTMEDAVAPPVRTRALKIGRYKLNAVQEMYVSEPERS
jgi:hypothetical protein